MCKNVDDNRIIPGCRVKVFDVRLFKNDKDTPLSFTRKPATVVARYGVPVKYYSHSETTLGPYPDLVDVKFDHRDEISHGHFTSSIEVIEDVK